MDAGRKPNVWRVADVHRHPAGGQAAGVRALPDRAQGGAGAHRRLDPLIRVAQPVMQGVVAGLHLPGALLPCRFLRKQATCIRQEFVERPASAASYERRRPMPLRPETLQTLSRSVESEV